MHVIDRVYVYVCIFVEVTRCVSLVSPRELARLSRFIASRISSVATFFWTLFKLGELVVKIGILIGGCRIMRADPYARLCADTKEVCIMERCAQSKEYLYGILY